MLFKLVPGASFRYKWKARKRTIIFLILLWGRDRMLSLFFLLFYFPFTGKLPTDMLQKQHFLHVLAR